MDARIVGAASVEYQVVGRADDHPLRALASYGTRGDTPLEWGRRHARRLGIGADRVVRWVDDQHVPPAA